MKMSARWQLCRCNEDQQMDLVIRSCPLLASFCLRFLIMIKTSSGVMSLGCAYEIIDSSDTPWCIITPEILLLL